MAVLKKQELTHFFMKISDCWQRQYRLYNPAFPNAIWLMWVLKSSLNGDHQGPELDAAESGSTGASPWGLEMVCPCGGLESPERFLLVKLCSVYEFWYYGKWDGSTWKTCSFSRQVRHLLGSRIEDLFLKLVLHRYVTR